MWSFDYVLGQNLTITFLVKNEYIIQSCFTIKLYIWFSVFFSPNESWFLSPSLIIVCYEHHWRTLSWTCIIHLNLGGIPVIHSHYSYLLKHFLACMVYIVCVYIHSYIDNKIILSFNTGVYHISGAPVLRVTKFAFVK